MTPAEMDTPTLLPETLRKGGFTYTLVERSGAGLIYAQAKDGYRVGYEVFRAKLARTTTRKLGGSVVRFGGGEKFPPDSAFGSWAWSYMTLEKARERLAVIDAEAEVRDA